MFSDVLLKLHQAKHQRTSLRMLKQIDVRGSIIVLAFLLGTILIAVCGFGGVFG